MTHPKDESRSIPQDNGGVGHEGRLEKERDAELHRQRQQDEQNGGAIPAEAGDDFTFPDEDSTLGRKAGDDLPGEPNTDRR